MSKPDDHAQRATRTTDVGDVDGHRWHSQDYVDAWIRERVAGNRPRDRAEHGWRTKPVLDAMDQRPEERFRVLDLGAGWGRLGAGLLERYPYVELTAVDFSVPMLDAARRQLAPFSDRVHFVCRDLSVPGVLGANETMFDAVVSVATLHHLRTERLATLYAEIAGVLSTGGLFINLDRVHRRAADWVVAAERILFGEAKDGTPRGGLPRLRSWLRIRPHAATHGGSLATHLALLSASGFESTARRVDSETLVVSRRS